MDASITSRPFELGTPRLDAGFLLGTSVAVLLLIYALLLPLGWPANSQMSGGPGGQALDAAAFAVVGLLIVRRQPGTSSGLILIGSAVLLLVSADAQLYLLLDYYGRDGELPLGRLAAALSPLWAGAIALAPALMMLFPDGRPISRGWRKAAWASAALTAAFLVLLALVVVSALWQEPLLVSPSGDLAVVADPSGWSGTVFGVGFACLAVALLIALTSVIERYRRVSGKQRQRLQWFLCGSALLVTTFVGRQVLVPTSEGPWALFGTIVLSVAVVAVPVGIGIGMLRHELYDIDRALVRALTMAALVSVVTLAYLGAATALGALVGSTVSTQPIFAIGATAVIALAFQPARTQAHRLAALLVYGRRAAPYEVLSDFARRIAGAEHVPDVLDRMAGLLRAATGAQSATVWLRTGNEFQRLLTRPVAVLPKAVVHVDGSEQPVNLDTHHALVRHGGRQLGALSVTLQQGQELSPTEATRRCTRGLSAATVRCGQSLFRDLRLWSRLRSQPHVAGLRNREHAGSNRRPGWRARGAFCSRPGNHRPRPDPGSCRAATVKIRVAVAEDNYVVRAGIEKILEADPDIELVGSCGDLDSLDRLIAAVSPHVVVTDIRMPPGQSDEGLEIARRLRRAESATGVVVLSQYAEPTYARALLEDGAAGRAYLLKDRVGHGSQLLRAVRVVAEGGSMIDPEVVGGLITSRTRRSGSAVAELTPREREVLTLIAEGRSNQGIAQTLAVSQSAVEKHVNAIFSKLGLDAEGGAHRRVRAALLYLADTHSG